MQLSPGAPSKLQLRQALLRVLPQQTLNLALTFIVALPAVFRARPSRNALASCCWDELSQCPQGRGRSEIHPADLRTLFFPRNPYTGKGGIAFSGDLRAAQKDLAKVTLVVPDGSSQKTPDSLLWSPHYIFEDVSWHFFFYFTTWCQLSVKSPKYSKAIHISLLCYTTDAF